MMKLFIIGLILLATCYYIFSFSPFFSATTFIAILAISFLFFYLLSSATKKKLINFFESNAKLLLVFLIVFALVNLYNAGLFDNGIIIFQDSSFHFYRTNLLTNVLLPKFQNVIGWTRDFQAGMPEFYDYPPLPYFITSFLYYLFQEKIALTFLFRITVAIGFIVPIIGIYRLTNSLFHKSLISLLSSLIWLGFPHNQFIFGNYTTYFALGFTFLGLSFYYDYLNNKKKYELLSTVLFFSLTFISNPMIIVPTFIVALLGIKKISLKDFILLSIGIFGISFIWFVQIYEGSEYLFYVHSQSLLVYPEWFNLFNQFFIRFLYVSPALFFFIFIGVIYKLDKPTERILLTIIVLIAFLVIVERLQPIFNILTLLQPEKTVMFMRGFFVILVVYLSYKLSEENELLKNKITKNLLFSLVLTALIGSSIIYIPYQFVGWHDHNSDILKQFLGYNPSYLSDGIFSYGLLPSVNETFSFIKNITDDQRILFEDSKEGRLGSTSTIALGPYFTEKNFIGGPFYHIALEDQNATAGDGIILGRNITEYSLDEMKAKLDAFDIGYIVAWTPEFINFLNKYPNDFKQIYDSSDKFLHVYKFLGSKNNYASTSNQFSTVKTTEFEDDLMMFEVKNASAGDKIIVKSTYNTHWKGYLDNQPITLERGDLHLISLALPSSGNFSLKIIYETTLLEKVAPFVSLISFIFIFLLAIYYLRRC